MRKKEKNSYIKHVYWLNLREVEDLHREDQLEMYEAEDIPCELLRKDIEVGYAPERVWSTRCSRQGSWYRESERAGLCLVVSSAPLERFRGREDVTITRSNFKAPRLPNEKEKWELVRSRLYQEGKPEQWEEVSPREKEKFQNLLRIGGVRDPFEKVFLTHCANHANFFEAKYFVERDSGIVPYSIADTMHVCSACAELFNIIGAQYRIKYVMSCPGAVMVAGIPANRYLEVKKEES